ncbi:unnamed protein product, partial [Owenia fusiformis]
FSANMAAPSVQYIVVRGDLMKALKWPLGAIIAQACHASSAVMHMFHDDKNTQEYLADIDRMHKVILDGKDEDVLNTLSEALTADGIDHKLWIEQPENIWIETTEINENKYSSDIFIWIISRNQQIDSERYDTGDYQNHVLG